jgi:phosphoserine aminotransferase
MSFPVEKPKVPVELPMEKPVEKPKVRKFGSGPTAKIDDVGVITRQELLGRSHRSALGLAHIQHLLDSLKTVLKIPEDYVVALVNGGGTGAMEFAMWNFLGPRTVDVFAAGLFGNHWLNDVENELKQPCRKFLAPFGSTPLFSEYNPQNDAVCVWVETPSGTVIPDAHWIPSSREGLVLCDATAALFCMEFPWDKMDVVAFSWQKGLGAEAGLGTLVCSPKALNRLQTSTPPWPLPRILRLPTDGLNDPQHATRALFWQGYTVNTISLLSLQDMQRALEWAQNLGGLPALIHRVQKVCELVGRWVEKTPWVEFFIPNEAERAKNVALLKIKTPKNTWATWPFLEKMAKFLDDNQAAYDVLNHRQSIPALRIWTGPVIDLQNYVALLPWLACAYEYASSQRSIEE